MLTLAALHAKFLRLDAPRTRLVHVRLCRHALHAWDAYIQAQGPLEYHDSVVGMHHTVDVALPRDAWRCVRRRKRDRDVAYRYLEPITALQDGDLSCSGPAVLSYYAIYNLYCKYIEGRAVDDWLIVNQALSCSDEPAQWARMLSGALRWAARIAPR